MTDKSSPPAPVTKKRLSMFYYIGITLLVLVVGLTLFVVTRPKIFKVERTALVHASPAVVFELLNNLHSGEKWSPFEKLDPNMKKTFTGPEIGPGASFAWSGNDKAGEGQMTILESRPNEQIKLDLKFTRPFACNNQVFYKLSSVPEGTQLSWSMEGPNTLPGKIMSLFINMDQMVGKDFEEGLSNIDKLLSVKP